MTKETIINKSDLFNYLDGFARANDTEILTAICDYIEKQEGVLYESDVILAGDLKGEYIDQKELYNIDFIDDDGNVIDFTETF